jgi:hypothetical protein
MIASIQHGSQIYSKGAVAPVFWLVCFTWLPFPCRLPCPLSIKVFPISCLSVLISYVDFYINEDALPLPTSPRICPVCYDDSSMLPVGHGQQWRGHRVQRGPREDVLKFLRFIVEHEGAVCVRDGCGSAFPYVCNTTVTLL